MVDLKIFPDCEPIREPHGLAFEMHRSENLWDHEILPKDPSAVLGQGLKCAVLGMPGEESSLFAKPPSRFKIPCASVGGEAEATKSLQLSEACIDRALRVIVFIALSDP